MHEHRTAFATRATFALAVILLADFPAVCMAEDSGLEATVRRVWKTRQDNAKSLRFEWKEEFDVPPATARMFGIPIAPDAKNLVHLPATCRLLLDGDRGRYEETCDRGLPKDPKLTLQPQIRVVTSKETRTLVPMYDQTSMLGTMEPKSDQSDLLATEGNVPISFAYRILHPDFQVFPVARMTVEERTTEKGRFVVATIPMSALHAELWLSPDRDYQVTRVLYVLATGKTDGVMEISYERDEKHGWIPTEWTSTNSLGTRHCKVSSYAINPTIEEREFQLEFPAGATVNEVFTGVTYKVGPNGERQIIGQGEPKPVVPPVPKSPPRRSET